MKCHASHIAATPERTSSGSSPVGRPANAMICVGHSVIPTRSGPPCPKEGCGFGVARTGQRSLAVGWCLAAGSFFGTHNHLCFWRVRTSAALRCSFETSARPRESTKPPRFGRRDDRLRLACSARDVSPLYYTWDRVRQTRICIAVDLPALCAGPPSTGPCTHPDINIAFIIPAEVYR
jgi:hypothetical protein